MNTINKFNTMKKSLTIFAFAILLMPLTAMAQKDIFAKYSDNNDVTYVSIKPKMFQMLAKMDIESDDKESQSYIDMVNSITSFKTIATDNKSIATDITKWVKTRSNSLDELMEFKDNGMLVKFYVKEIDDDHVSELLMFVNGLDAMMKDSKVTINGKKRSIETVVISLTGNIDINQISKLTKQMNLPGGDKN